MRIQSRQIPEDRLSFSHDGHDVFITTHRSNIIVSVKKDGQSIVDEMVPVNDFIAVLKALRTTEI
jgi:hypothetical protein